MSEGSENEVINLLFLAYDLNFIKEEDLNLMMENLEEIIKMINGFRNKLNN
jgi:four helix bundle protein